MAGDSPETFGVMRFEAIIVGQKRTLTLRVGSGAVNRFCFCAAQSLDRAAVAPPATYLLPFGTVTVTFFLLALPDASRVSTTIV